MNILKLKSQLTKSLTWAVQAISILGIYIICANYKSKLCKYLYMHSRHIKKYEVEGMDITYTLQYLNAFKIQTNNVLKSIVNYF